MIKALRRLSSFANLGEVTRFAIDIIEAWNILVKDKWLSRQTLVIDLASGNNTIAHTLGYVPTGYIITTRSAAISHYLVSKTSTNIVINVNAAVSVTLEVY